MVRRTSHNVTTVTSHRPKKINVARGITRKRDSRLSSAQDVGSRARRIRSGPYDLHGDITERSEDPILLLTCQPGVHRQLNGGNGRRLGHRQSWRILSIRQFEVRGHDSAPGRDADLEQAVHDRIAGPADAVPQTD